MAGLAFGFGVQAAQGEFRRLVMIEIDDAPFFVGVAGVAFGDVFSSVFVLKGVAGNAGEREAGVAFGSRSGSGLCSRAGAGWRAGLGRISDSPKL